MKPLDKDVAPKGLPSKIEDFDIADSIRLKKDEIRKFLIDRLEIVPSKIDKTEEFVENFVDTYADKYLYDRGISFGDMRNKLKSLERTMNKINHILYGSNNQEDVLINSIADFEFTNSDVLANGFTGVYGDIYLYMKYNQRILNIIQKMIEIKSSHGKEIRVVFALNLFSDFYERMTEQKFRINKDETGGKTVEEHWHRAFKGAHVRLFADLIRILEPKIRAAKISSALTSFRRSDSGKNSENTDIICPEIPARVDS